MDLRGFESYTTTGLPVVGANVYRYAASLTHPNPGAVQASTTTSANGMWEFTGIADGEYDIKVEFGDRVRWYKGKSAVQVAGLGLTTGLSNADDVALTALDINGGVDIGAAIADADLMIIDDGGGGTNRKTAVTRLPTYTFTKISGDVTINSSGVAAIGAGKVLNSMMGITYTAFTPTVSQGGAVTVTVNAARYAIMGKFAHVYFLLTATSAGTIANAITVTLPAALTTNAAIVMGIIGTIGAGAIYDISATTLYQAHTYLASTTTLNFVDTNASNPVALGQGFALAANDNISANLVLELA